MVAKMNIKGRRMIKGNGFCSLGKLVKSGAETVANRAKKQANDIMDEMPKLNLLAKTEQVGNKIQAYLEQSGKRVLKGVKKVGITPKTTLSFAPDVSYSGDWVRSQTANHLDMVKTPRFLKGKKENRNNIKLVI
jgi:hypothetical protein